jgi:hypothetical protein
MGKDVVVIVGTVHRNITIMRFEGPEMMGPLIILELVVPMHRDYNGRHRKSFLCPSTPLL